MTASNSVPKDVICRFTEQEIKRFTLRVAKAEQGLRGYNLEECRRYLGIWKSIEAKGYDWEKLTQEERDEVADALDDDE